MNLKILMALALVVLAGCQTNEVTNNEASMVDPATYAPRRPASSPDDLNARIKFTHEFSFSEQLQFSNFPKGGSCTISQPGNPGEKHEIATDQIYALSFNEGSFFVGALGGQTGLSATVFCADAKHKRLQYTRDFNLRDVLRALGAVLTK
jgi:hypothetical protein